MAREIKNAKIESTYLGLERMFTCFLNLKYDGEGQSFGGYVFDQWDEEEGRRVGHAFGAESIMGIISTLEAESWEKLPGIYCRADADFGKIYRIGHIIKDKWFSFEDGPQEGIKATTSSASSSHATL